MSTFIKYLKQGLTTVSSTFARANLKGIPKLMIILLLFLIFFSSFIYILSCCVDWWLKGSLDRPALISLIETLTSTSFLAAIVIFGKSFVDSNNNSIPDAFESTQVNMQTYGFNSYSNYTSSYQQNPVSSLSQSLTNSNAKPVGNANNPARKDSD